MDTTEARLAWQHWNDLVNSGDAREIANTAVAAFDVLGTAVRPVQIAAREVLESRRCAWQPVADQIREWVAAERASRQANTMYTALRKAITWLESVSNQIRNEKLTPIAVEATDIWKKLRHESNVDLGAIRLAGTGPNRRVDLDVTVDGEPGSALAVMSQGELHSLALALFLPRATMQQSPFRFLVIDDPVQSMDPAKVQGLAEVLDEVAKDRQVIVFTHDDRLPAAVRRLGLKAHIRTVSRLARSHVVVDDEKNGNPARRYLDDAWAIACDEEMDDKVRRPVICSLVRDAIEYTCHELIRARDLRHGVPIADTEDAINAVHRLRPLLALALLGNAQRAGDLPKVLDGVHFAANRVVDAANKGTHGEGCTSFTQLVREAQQVVEGLSRK